MKRFCVLLVAACLTASLVSTASANYVLKDGDQVKVVNQTNPVSGYNGGPFKLDIVSPSLPSESFISFCLEKSETISLGGTYFVTVDAYAIRGGGDTNSLPPHNTDADKDYLSWAAGTLYQTFRQGGLAAAITGWVGSTTDMIALQNAFWELEDEGVTTAEKNAGTSGMQANLVAWAKGHADSNNATRVINLYDSTGNRQSMMTLVPEPASIAIWGFIATVFGGGMYMRRRRAQ